jgi:hypothetical protein
MPDRIQSYKIVSRGGLQSSENHLELAEDSPGTATRLVNYEVSLFGGYRRIDGYQPFDDLAQEVAPGNAEGPVLGIAIYQDPFSAQSIVIAARKDQGSETYSFYRHVPLSGWELMILPTGVTRQMSTVSSGRTVTRVRSETFHFGLSNQICFVDGVNNAIVFDGFDWFVLDPSGNGNSSSPGGDQLLAAPAVVDVFKNHLFLSSDAFNPAIVAHSAPNDALNFTAASGAGQVLGGVDVVQIKPFRDNLFVFGENMIKKIIPDVQAAFTLENVTSNVGCIARDSVQEIGGDLVFLAPDGIRPVAGTSRIGDVELEAISRSIQSIVVKLPEQYDLDTLSSVIIRGKSQLRYFMGGAEVAGNNAFGIIGGLRAVESAVTWEFGELVGIRASCCVSGFVNKKEFVLHGDYDGRVYRQEVGSSFNGEDIVSVYQTPYIDFGDTQVRKVLRKVNTFIRAEGPFTMNMSVTYDWDDPFTLKPNSYAQSSAGAPTRYNSTGIDYAGTNVIYGGAEKPIILTDIQGSGFAVQLTYVTVGQDASHSLQGAVIEFSATGRR